MTLRRILLWTTAAIGTFVGLWAAIWPTTFYSSFPGLGRVWIAVDGPFNEHLIRDVGSLYLALAAASIAAAFTRGPEAGRVVGVAWTVFGLPHLIYHAVQFDGMPIIDVIGNIISLGGSLLLGIVLMLPGSRAKRTHPETSETKESTR
ncbi:hypothetical protein [Microbacterium sp.]|uniref:hypothetical protein n=1 Tax=Microbacterium sp. TaxID=51671 RepID=UPI002733496B|nr:hypothetical protein [Microbacterium sp.]MDP3952222.1 hypothetical protein [Microbacterium sp.]